MIWFAVIAGYLIGSIPTAYLAGRLLRGVDIRQLGDGNMGAGNAFRQLGAKAGIAVGVIDGAKGALAIGIANLAGLSELGVMASGVAAVAGHNWPFYLGFRGGRGEATTIGILLVIITMPVLIVTAPTIATLVWRKNVVLASAVMFVPLPFISWIMGFSPSVILYSIGLPGLVGLTHYFRTRHTVHVSGVGGA